MTSTVQPLVITFPFPPHPDLAVPSTDLRNRQLLSTISSASSIHHLKQIHAHILRLGVDHSNSLLAKLALSSLDYSTSPSPSPSLHYAISVFGQIPYPEIRVTNRFLRDLSRSNQPLRTLSLYGILRRKGLKLDRFSFPPLLKASSKSLTFKIGMEIHGLAAKLGFDRDPFVQTALVAMYAACGRILVARSVFDRMSHRDVVSWSTMIDGYCQSALFSEALELYEEIKSSNIEPDGIILSSILSACGRSGNLSCGKEIHEFITMNNMIDDYHLQSALITMYSNCGSMEDAQNVYQQLQRKNIVVSTAMISGYSKLGKVEVARSIFNQIEVKDLVCWSAMISGYADSNQPQEALELFKEMQKLRTLPDQVTMLSVISACANLGALDVAKSIHIHVDRSGFGVALPINNALIDMYAKCGSLKRAISVFNGMSRKNVISWTTMINSFAIHGDASNALTLFHQMKIEGIQPNGATFVSVLYACSHAGLVEEGRRIFASMKDEHEIIPKHEHYGCMVDLFGRSNLIREALEVVEQMPLPPNIVIWGSLMAACRIHGELELGEFAAKRVLELKPNHDGAHIFLSNVYAKEKRWEDVGQLRMLMKNKGILKERAASRIELRNEIHEFLMADNNHKQADEIYLKLEEVVAELKLIGYTPNTCDVLVDVDEEDEKVKMVLRHSEKLALCYGLIGGTKGSSCIRIVKNLRICEDCHTFMKYVSKVYKMNIIVRDRTRFHHYKDGLCSCNDRW